MCLSTDKLKFIDMVNYLAPGYSYDKYLKAHGCELEKGHFPYEYMDDLLKLDDRALPPQEAFYSRLKDEGISDEEYALCQVAWRDNGMKTMRDFLVWYNKSDVVPFLQAIEKQFAFYQQQNINMFKDGISVPGLTLLYLFNNLPSKTYFTVFNKTNSDLLQLVKNNIVGGPPIPREGYHQDTGRRDVSIDSRVRCQCSVPVGTDAGHAYGMVHASSRAERIPSSTSPTVRTDGVQWLTWESVRTERSIRHQVNGREKRIDRLPVDGWCAKTHTAYQFHGCYFHGCPKCYDENEMNSVNGKTMAELLANTKTHTAYLRRFVEVVEMWECEWKGKWIESDTKRFIDHAFISAMCLFRPTSGFLFNCATCVCLYLCVQ